MTRRRLVGVVRYLQRLARSASGNGLSDAELLERYVRSRDEAAFELLLWRHGVLVFNVCRRILHSEQDAEDAFQATFLAFVRKARAIARRGSVAAWLYKVAYRVALEAKARAQKTAAREKPGGESLAIQPAPDPIWDDVRPILDEELNRLPERLRRPLVLCYLEGKTNEEAARELGCRPGTVFSRLSRGREMLRSRLLRRGVTLSVAALTAALCQHAAEAVPAAFFGRSAAQAALSFAGLPVSVAVPPRVTALAEGVLRTMFVTKLKMAGLVLFLVGALAAGGVLTHARTAAPQPEAQPENPPPEREGAEKPAAKPVPVRVVKPTPGGLERTTAQATTVFAAQQQQIVPLVSGTLKTVNVDIGDRVKQGQVLAVLDSPLLFMEMKQAAAAVQFAKGQFLEAKARVTTAEAELKAAIGRVKAAEGKLKSDKAYLNFREQQARRYRVLFETKSIDQRLVDEQEERRMAASEAVGAATAALASAQADVEVKRSKIESAKAALASPEANLTLAELVLEKAQIQVGFTRITAAFDGVVTRRTIDPGNYVQVGDSRLLRPLLTVQRLDLVNVVAQISEGDAPLVAIGDPVELTLDALPGRPIKRLKISRVSPVLDPEHRTLRVEIEAPNAEGRLLPGMVGRATIHMRKRTSNALVVPSSCVVLTPSDQNAVYVIRDGKAHRTPIKVGAEDRKKVEIIEGVKASDLIVTDPEKLQGGVVPVEIKKGP